jgi:hypothetical protein
MEIRNSGKESDTPRTDAIISAIDMDAAFQDLCRQLERELSASKAEVERLKEALKSCWHAANTYNGNYTAACDNVMYLASPFLTS